MLWDYGVLMALVLGPGRACWADPGLLMEVLSGSVQLLYSTEQRKISIKFWCVGYEWEHSNLVLSSQMHKPHVWADTQGSIVHQLKIGIYYFLPLGQNGNNLLSSELLGQQNCIVPHTEELVMCLNGRTMWYNKNQEYDMRQDETWGIHTCVPQTVSD